MVRRRRRTRKGNRKMSRKMTGVHGRCWFCLVRFFRGSMATGFIQARSGQFIVTAVGTSGMRRLLLRNERKDSSESAGATRGTSPHSHVPTSAGSNADSWAGGTGTGSFSSLTVNCSSGRYAILIFCE